jgi:alkylated DNA repair dioxygenase AlkB
MSQQLSLWNVVPQVEPALVAPGCLRVEKLCLLEGDVTFYADAFPRSQADCWFQQLLADVDWQQDYITLYRKSLPLPRLTAWYGDPGKTYTYSGIQMPPTPWTPPLLAIKSQVEALTEGQFNSVLLNLYRQGQDSVAWHSDDEPEMGDQPTIASVSLGGTRRFSLRHREHPHLRQQLDLTHGSVLLMKGSTQQCWQHQIPKTRKPVLPRINLTFRTILETGH